MSAKKATCAQCGKKFFVGSPRDWAYRDKTAYFCGWKCIREHDAHIPPHKTDEPEKIPQVMPEETAERIRKQVEAEERRSVKMQSVTPAKQKREYKKNKSAEKILRVMHAMQRVRDAMDGLAREVEAMK